MYVSCYIYNKYKNDNVDIFVAIRNKDKEYFLNTYQNLNPVILKDLPFPIWEQLLLPRSFKSGGYDVLHCPYNTFPILYGQIYNRLIVTIHDLIFFKKLGDSLYQITGNMYRRFVLHFIRDNVRVITVSNASKKELMNILRRRSNVIMESNELIKKQRDSIKDLKHYDKKYLFHIGGINETKNTDRVIKAFLNAKLDDYYLVISGLPKCNIYSKQYDNNSIIYTGWVSDEKMAEYYMNADAIIFPSLREGFGLPIQEGLTFNKPVLTSKLEPMTEVAGEAAIFVDPFSIDSITKGIKEILLENVRCDLYKNINKQLKKFDGRYICEKYMTVYESVK